VTNPVGGNPIREQQNFPDPTWETMPGILH